MGSRQDDSSRSTLAIEAIRDLARAGRLDAARVQARQLRVSIPESDATRLSDVMLLEVELAQSPEASRALEVEFLELSTIHKQKRLSALCIALSARLPSASPEDRLSRTDRALTIDPDCSIAHMNRAESLEILQKDAAALKEWKAASDSVHAPALALSLHARALAKRGRDRAAVALYRQLTSRNHDDFEAIYNLGTLLLTRLNESREAYKWLTLALKKSPADYDVVFNLAVAALRTDHIEEAEGLLDQAKRIRPNDPEVHFNLALLYADYRRQPQAAIQCFQTYLALGGQEKLRVNRWMKELGGDGDDKQK